MSSDGSHQLTEGGEVLATLLDVLGELATGRNAVSLEGQVVVRNLLVVTLDGLEDLVGSGLHTGGDLEKHGLLGSLEVAAGTVRDALGTGLTLLDVAVNLSLEILAEGLVLGADQGTVLLAVGLVLADDTSEHLEATGSLPGVGCDTVGHGHQTSIEAPPGSDDGSLGLLGVLVDLLGALGVGESSGELDLCELSVELASGSTKVATSLASILGGLGADRSQLAGEESVEGLHFLVGSLLVGIEESTELATGTDRLGGAQVGAELGGLEAEELLTHELDLTEETGLLVLDGRSGGGNAGGEGLASITHLLGSSSAGCLDVLNSLLEAGILERSLLGDVAVHLVHLSVEPLVGLLALLGHLGEGLREAVLGSLVGLLHRSSDLAVDRGEAS